MNDRGKLVLAAAAVALAGVCASQARAGNCMVGNAAQYFSVQVASGSYLSYGGTDSDAIMLIDDITYCAEICPCDATECCAYWSEDLEGPPPSTGGNPIPHLTEYGKAFATARCHDPCVELFETDGNNANCNHFDCMSHSTHSEIFILHDEYECPPLDVPPSGPGYLHPGGAVPPGLRSTVRYADAVNCPDPPDIVTVKGVTGFGMSSWAVETSQSRHYQSPQIVQHGHHVWLGNMYCSSGAKYCQAKVFLKGRIILDPNMGPTENTDVSVTAGP